jgi:hypothetical protein
LRSLSLARLKKYVDAYNIGADGVIEKDDLIERIIAVRVSVSFVSTFIVVDFRRRRMDAYRTQTRYECVFIRPLYSVCSLSNYRHSTGGTLSPMVGLVDPVGCSQDVRGQHLYNPPHPDNLPVILPPRFPVQISIRLDNRDRHLRREDRCLILRLRYNRNLHLTRSRIHPHVQLRLQRPLLDPSQPPRLTYLTHSLGLRRLIPQDRAPRPEMATQQIQSTVHHQPFLQHHLLYHLWTNCWP